MRASKVDPETAGQLRELAERLERIRFEQIGMLFQAVRTITELGEKRFGPMPAPIWSAVTAIHNVERANRIINRLLDAATRDDLLATP